MNYHELTFVIWNPYIFTFGHCCGLLGYIALK